VAAHGDHGAGGDRFVRRLVTLGAGEERPYVEAEWRDTLIVIVRGALELRCQAGGARRFAAGAILWTQDLGLRQMVNPGDSETLLIAVSRRGSGPDPEIRVSE
jgi:hypothetical protein